MPGISNVDFSPSSITVARPPGLGRVYYVDGLDGLDTNNGINPGTPFKTIAHALTLCNYGANVKGWNDYIIVFNHWQETVPIVVNKKRVHIIGVGYPGRPMVVINASIDEPVFQIAGDDGDFCEIAGFDLGGGSGHAAIEDLPAVGTADFVYIHDCNFGSEMCGNTPRDGILLAAGSRSWKIERCTFLGNEDTAGGALTRDGVRITGGNAVHTEIAKSLFIACPGIAINVDSKACIIRENDIAVSTDVAGKGITLGAGSSRCLISYNKAAWGEEETAQANPFLDNAGEDANAWTANFKCEKLSGPD